MKFSYNWLQSYFDKELPNPEKLAELFTFQFTEVEGVERLTNDTLIDINVLPDRACYALSHRGIAREISAILEIPLKPLPERDLGLDGMDKFPIDVQDHRSCPRYIGALVENVEIVSAPDWVTQRLSSVGQRSINGIVDIANYLMLDLGQPLHAFDADKVEGTLTVRKAVAGEIMTTLDNKELTFDGSELLISDKKGPLGLAGIKGGKRAEVTSSTTRLILEAANFDPTELRKASTKHGIRTDASKRFENSISQYLPRETMNQFITMILDTEAKNAKLTMFRDVHTELPARKTVDITLPFVREVLGTDFTASEAENIFKRLEIDFIAKDDSYTLTVPDWRLDLLIPEDIVEEIGRFLKYENVSPILPPKVGGNIPVLKSFDWQDSIREFLVGKGFSEVITYSFTQIGVAEVVKSMASDKNFLRDNLSANMESSLQANLTNAPLLNSDQVKQFEIGKVFTQSGEETHLCIGISQPKGFKGGSVNDQIRDIRDALVTYLGAPITTLCSIDDTGGLISLSGHQIGMINNIDGILELNLDSITEVLGARTQYADTNFRAVGKYRPVSQYPFVVRDAAVYVGQEESFDDIKGVVTTLLQKGTLPNVVVSPESPFDEFVNEKLGKKSFAFRIVFQSQDKTLTDAEVNSEMEHVYSALKERGWEVR